MSNDSTRPSIDPRKDAKTSKFKSKNVATIEISESWRETDTLTDSQVNYAY